MNTFCAVILSLTLCGQMWSAEIISLGGACNVARASRQGGLRTLAYPFDWLITPLPALKEAFEEDFVRIAEEMRLREDGKAAIDAYGLVYIHDFPTIRNPEAPVDGEIMPVHPLVENWEEAIPIVKAKFRRRLTRMTKLLEEGRPVVLVRYQDMGRQEAEEWIALLRKKYPRACLDLAVLGSTSEFQTPWDIPHVRNFYISEEDLLAWQGPMWDTILQEIATLEPPEWSADGYVLTMPNYNPGLFNTFNTILGALDAYDRGRFSSLSIDFGKQGAYFDPEQGDNWWTYYFEPICLGRGTGLFPTYKKIEFAYKAQYEMSRDRAYELIQKYIHVLPHIDLNGYRKGEEAVIDCLLLSRCSLLLKMASNLSDCSLQFQPTLPVIRLNKSYSE